VPPLPKISAYTPRTTTGCGPGLFQVADLAEVPMVGPVLRAVAYVIQGSKNAHMIHESIGRVIDRLVGI